MNVQANPFLFESAALSHLPNYGPVRSTQLCGYLSIGDSAGGWLYFWFSEAVGSPERAPLLVWINSGPGIGALATLFDEHGPYLLDSGGRVYSNPFSWHHHANYLLLDQPLGHGLSFSTHPRYLPESHDESCQQLYHALQEFLLRWPRYREVDCYLFGAGQTGHTLARLANAILDGNGCGQPLINLKGIGLGNGQVAPEIQLPSHIDYASQHRLINEEERQRLEAMLQDYIRTRTAVTPLQRKEASHIAQDMNAYIRQCSGRDLDDVRHPPSTRHRRVEEYLARPAVQQALHIDPRSLNELKPTPQSLLEAAWLESSAPLFPRLLEKLKVLLYHGEYCLEGNYLGADAWLDALPWSGAAEFRQCKRQSWRPYGLAAGLIRQHHHLSHIIIQNAGLHAAHDQPAIVQAMLKHFLHDDAG
ncbi:S10 family serine carboxypeptidase-like protein [Chromobacterium sp. CV08]|uniref:S10 family serine carboxypeptidase-like protein n=1 Tax=Chromobacterium sp. CV08 TaxID=3133274 RepID=UPI003DA8AD7F